MAELDFRRAEGGPSYLIEVNPRFFGGLPQAVAANVDFHDGGPAKNGAGSRGVNRALGHEWISPVVRA
jgi:hypothetical protein